jgi:hypothetical protein
MHRFSIVAAVVLLLSAGELEAQSGTRLILAPQVGGVVAHSQGAEADAFGSLVAEVQAGRGWSLSAEATTSMSNEAIRVCHQFSDPCTVGTDIRSAAAAGVVMRGPRLSVLEPYAGVSGGVARWSRVDERGYAPLAAARAGLDLRVVGPFGVRADFTRRMVWADTPEGSPLHTDVFSLGAWFAVRR